MRSFDSSQCQLNLWYFPCLHQWILKALEPFESDLPYFTLEKASILQTSSKPPEEIQKIKKILEKRKTNLPVTWHRAGTAGRCTGYGLRQTGIVTVNENTAFGNTPPHHPLPTHPTINETHY